MAIATSPSTGSRAKVTIGEQVVFTTPVAPTHILDFTSESLAAQENNLVSEAIRGDRGIHKLVSGTEDIQGDISFELAASGYGMLMRHALGDYIRLPLTDGGFRARCAVNAVQVLDAGDHANDGNEILLAADDISSEFPSAGGDLMIVYRTQNDGQGALLSQNGYAYEGFSGYATSRITAVEASDTTYTGYVSVAAVSIVVAPVANADDVLVNLTFNPAGGVIECGPLRRQYRYFQATDLGAGLGTRLYLDPSQALVATPASHPVVGTICNRKATFSSSTTDLSDAVTAGHLKIGSWLYLEDTTNFTDGVETAYTHHLERGTRLPVAGLTIEVDRDAAIFIYVGCKVNTLTVTFETNAIVTGTFSLIGRNEIAMAELAEDVIPGQTSILFEDKYEKVFPAAGTITIGERTGITYTTKEVNYLGSGNTRLSGIPASGVASIDRVHLKGVNVDSRTSTRVGSPQSSSLSPLTSFEILVYMNGSFEEALAGSVTLNNNLNGEKFGLGAKGRLGIIEEDAVVEASLTLEFDDGKNYGRFKEAKYFSLEFKCISESDDSPVGNTDVLSQAYFYMPKCKFTGNTPVVEGKSYIVHDMPSQCIVDDDLVTTDLVVVLVSKSQYDVVAP